MLGFSFNGFTQFNNDLFVDSTQRLSFYAGMDFSYGSNVMSNQFSNKFLFGGTIDRDLKDDTYKNLGTNNRLVSTELGAIKLETEVRLNASAKK